MKDAIHYTVTVEATIEREEVGGKEWKPTTTAPGADYAYTPQIRQVVTRNIEVFKQAVDTLELKDVIAAVNGLRIAP